MTQPLMPKLTAVWLLDNTTLTFDQIAEFCGLHILEIQAIADGEVAVNVQGLNPVATGQISLEEIKRCEANPKAHMALSKSLTETLKKRKKGAKYTPLSRRGDKPDAIAWLLRQHPELADTQIAKLIGTTKTTVKALRDKTYWNASQVKPRDPVTLGFCSQEDIVAVLKKQERAAQASEPKAKKVKAVKAPKAKKIAAPKVKKVAVKAPVKKAAKPAAKKVAAPKKAAPKAAAKKAPAKKPAAKKPAAKKAKKK